MTPDDFYDAQLDQSAVKTEIVTKYFDAWARIMLPQAGRIAYVDLFSGPGIYSDGSPSTPLLVLDLIAGHDVARVKTATFFNDVNPDYISMLDKAITERGYSKLTYTPALSSLDAGDALDLVRAQVADAPTLYFVDPWGYKGVSLELLAQTVCDWGCECVLFFNYNRINGALENDLVSEHMDALFGAETAASVRASLVGLSPEERESAVIEGIVEALTKAGARYVLPFRFVDEHGTRTSHHLIFMTKHVLGYTIMKDIMARASSTAEQGVPLFEYNPATANQPLLFEYARPLDELGDLLLQAFAGHSIQMSTIFDAHHVGRRYVKKNYKDALMRLEAEGRITATPCASDRRAGTMADHVLVTFPGV